MPFPLARLAALLAELFPDQASSQRIMASAGIHAERIDVEMPARSRWFYIVDEAKKADLLFVLLEVAISEYPGQADLRKLRSEMTRAERLSKPHLTVLAIWPTLAGANPEGADEADSALYDAGIDYIALQGEDATRDNVVREWGRVEPDIVEVMTHGKDGKIYLTDGPTRPGWWGRLVLDHPPRLMLLLACEVAQAGAIDIPDALIREGVAAVIAVDDRLLVTDAIRFARTFYAELSQDGNISHAFERARLTMSDEGSQMIRLRQRHDLEADRQARDIVDRS